MSAPGVLTMSRTMTGRCCDDLSGLGALAAALSTDAAAAGQKGYPADLFFVVFFAGFIFEEPVEAEERSFDQGLCRFLWIEARGRPRRSRYSPLRLSAAQQLLSPRPGAACSASRPRVCPCPTRTSRSAAILPSGYNRWTLPADALKSPRLIDRAIMPSSSRSNVDRRGMPVSHSQRQG